MFLSDLSIKRPILMTMVLVALLLFGVIAYTGLSLSLMPEINVPYVTVQTTYAGASPNEIATQITELIEDQIGTISGIKGIQSYSLDSASIIIIEFELSKDADVATQEVKDKVDQIINDLPDDADAPIVQKVDITAFPVVNLVLRGDIEMSELTHLAQTTVKDQLARIDGVGEVTVSGGREREIRVEFDNRTIYENSISLVQVSHVLAATNLDMPGGNIQVHGYDLPVRLSGELETVSDIADLEIPTANGHRRLGSIAEVRDSGEDVRSRTTFFDNITGERDESTVLVGIVKGPDGNPVEIADEIYENIPIVEEALPAGVSLTITSDDSEAVRGTVNDTFTTIIMGIGLTALVLLFFLHDLRSTIIVALAMPMSIVPTFLVMHLIGMSLNLMSLMGISTAIGVLVVNSVVVLENIFRHKEMGHDRKTAAANGTAEVTVAVIASTLTNIAVFLPMATASGMAGLFLKEFALSVTFTTIFSLLISFTLTPMLASKLLPEVDKKKHPIGSHLEAGFHRMEKGYAYILEKALHSKPRSAALLLTVLGLFVLAMVGFGRIPFDFVPAMDLGQISVEVELPSGTDLDQTAETLRTIEERIAQENAVETIVVTLGSLGMTETGTNLARIGVKLIDKEMRLPDTAIVGRLNESLADVPGAEIKVAVSSGLMSSMSGPPVEFYLQGDDSATLTDLSQQLLPMLSEIPGLVNIGSSSKPGKPEVVLYPDRIKLDDAGLTVQELALTLRASVEGVVMTTFREGGEEYDIRVTLSDADVSRYEDISSIVVPTQAGILPIEQFADVRLEEGVNQILREDKAQAIEFTAYLASGVALSDVSGPIETAVEELGLPLGYNLSWGGDVELLDETVRDFLFIFVLAVVLTYMLLAAILEKFGQPLLILFTVPLALIGVVAVFLMFDFSMSLIAMFAVIMLVGLVVNNAILILDYANQLRATGKGVREALLIAAPTKLKPILMSNIATMLGMLPMALGIGSWGAEMRQPMGVVSIGGLLAATFLTLFAIPALENLIESKKEEAFSK